jgi:hypothetical protein
MLGLTFGCPSVAPENPVTRDTVGSGLVHLFERESDEDLVRAVVEAVERRGDRGGLPPEFVARYDPAVISGQFAHQLTTHTGDAGDTA